MGHGMIGGGMRSWGRRGVEGGLKIEVGDKRKEVGGIWSLGFVVQIAVGGSFYRTCYHSGLRTECVLIYYKCTNETRYQTLRPPSRP